MSYPRDLDEIPEPELLGELRRREAARGKGLCDYCGRKLSSEPACKFPERHSMAKEYDPYAPYEPLSDEYWGT